MNNPPTPTNVEPAPTLTSVDPAKTSGQRPYGADEWQAIQGSVVTASAPRATVEIRAWSPGDEVEQEEGQAPSEMPEQLERVRLGPVHILCFLLTLTVYVALVPRFVLYSSPPTGDQPFYLMDVISMVEDRDLNVKNNYDKSDFDKFYGLAPHPPDFVGMGAPYPLPRQLANSTARPLTEEYAFHLPGLSVLLVPAWIVGSWFELWWPATVVFMCFIGALVALNVMLLAHQVSGRLWIGVAVWLPLAFSNPIMTYSYMLFTELTVGLFLIYVVRRLALGWDANNRWMLLLLGVIIGYIPWMAWRCVPLAAMLSVYATIQWWRHRRKVRISTKTQRRQEDDGNAKVFTGDGLLAEGNPAGGDPSHRSDVSGKEKRGRPKGKVFDLMLVLAPAVISVLLIFAYNMFLFGKPLPDNKVPELGDQNPFYFPWAGIDQLTTFASNTFGLLFDKQFGLLVYAPIYLLTFVGLIAMFQVPGSRLQGQAPGGNPRKLLLSMALVVLPYLGLIMAFHFWTGIWCPPARYLTTLVPLAAAPLAMSIVALSGTPWSWVYKIIYGLLALPGFAFMAIMIGDARRMWPTGGPPVFTWLAEASESPLSQTGMLHLDLRPILPNFSPPDPINLPATSGWITAGSLGVVLLCYFLMMRRSGFPSGTVVERYGHRSVQDGRWSVEGTVSPRGALRYRRLPYALHGVIWLLALSIVGGGWFAANHKFLEPKTILVQQNRWQLPQSPSFSDPGGITYLGGKIYITAFGPRSATGEIGLGEMGELDPATGIYRIIQPVYQGSPLPWAHPGDVKVGPGGLLYVLNNGEAPNVLGAGSPERSLYVMKPDGEVLNQIGLTGKSGTAKGLHFDTKGYMYVGDMVGGKVIKYEMGGGAPLATYTGMSDGLNNISGVYVDEGGEIYTTETFEWVQELDGEGRFIRKYELGCRPNYIVPNGEWLDVSCHSGLVSIRKGDGKIQRGQVSNDAPQLQGPTGMTYGPDGTLYVLDVNVVIAYTVRH